jgi:methyltransferase (TIGR00027 family)
MEEGSAGRARWRRRRPRARLAPVQQGQPSRTALAAAAHRAAHQVIEEGRVFRDPLALRILGDDADALVQKAQSRPAGRPMRLFIAARTRFAEDALAAAVARGTRQLVVLGAGLDTFAHRNPHAAAGLAVYEVDHPATQAWKRDRLAGAGLAPPPSLTFAPVDFERETLAGGLGAAGFDAGRAAFFTWLGVVPYLTRDAILATLRFVAGLGGGGEVVFDYSDPPSAMTAERAAAHAVRAERVAARGEPWLTYFTAPELDAELRALGLTEIEDLDPPAIAARFFGAAGERVPAAGGHVIRALTSLSRGPHPQPLSRGLPRERGWG